MLPTRTGQGERRRGQLLQPVDERSVRARFRGHADRLGDGLSSASGLGKPLDFDPHTCGVGKDVELLDTHAHRVDPTVLQTHRRDFFRHGLDQLDVSIREKPPNPKGYFFVTHHVGDVVVKVPVVANRQIDVDPDALAIRSARDDERRCCT